MQIQDEVGTYIRQHSLLHPPEVHALDLISEVGELVKEILLAGDFAQRPVEANENLTEETGDTFLSLIALAESLDVDLETALRAALEKYEARYPQKEHDGSSAGEPASPITSQST